MGAIKAGIFGDIRSSQTHCKTRVKKYLCAAALVLYFKSITNAELRYNILYNVFSQDGSGGKQVYDGSGDQDLTVYEPALFMDCDIDYKTVLSGSFLLDTFTSASDSIFDSKTGASGLSGVNRSNGNNNSDDAPERPNAITVKREWEYRQAFDLSISRRMGTWLVIPSFGYSGEVDYKSAHGGLNFQKSFAEDNFTLSAGMFHYNDEVQLYDLSTGRFTGWTPKITDSYILSATQILGQKDIALVGASFTRQTGHLSRDRDTVSLAGTRAAEVLPGARNKITSTLRLVHELNGFVAFHFDYRYYTDDWDINAHAFAPSLAIGFDPADAGLIRLLYRYYVQTGAAYYRDSFNTAPAYMTSDSDLAPFNATEAGIQGSYRLDTNGETEFGGGIIFYNRSNDLKAVIYQLSLGGKF